MNVRLPVKGLMSDHGNPHKNNPERAAREKRLAEALRANLRRRKGAVQPRNSESADGSEGDRQEAVTAKAGDEPSRA